MGQYNNLFSVGQKVKVIDNTCWHEFKIGEVCEIMTVNEVNYTVSNCVDSWQMLDEELEPVEE